VAVIIDELEVVEPAPGPEASSSDGASAASPAAMSGDRRAQAARAARLVAD
jgi:hypothetical protein